MALNTESALAVGAVLGYFGHDTANNGLANLGKLGSVFVSNLNNLYHTAKDSLGNMHVDLGKPLQYAGKAVKLAYDTTKGVARAVVMGAGGVWNALTDEHGNPITPTGVAAGDVNQDGSFRWANGISNDEIQRLSSALSPTTTGNGYMTPIPEGQVIDSTGQSQAIGTTPDNGIDRNKMILYIGGGAIAVLLLILIMKGSSR